jgi:hypothetical protein
VAPNTERDCDSLTLRFPNRHLRLDVLADSRLTAALLKGHLRPHSRRELLAKLLCHGVRRRKRSNRSIAIRRRLGMRSLLSFELLSQIGQVRHDGNHRCL